jgi:hypothetical protein
MKKQLLLVVSLLTFGTSHAMAAITTYNTRAVDNGVNSSDYKASWSAQTSAITSQTLADFNGAILPGGLGNGVTAGFSFLDIAFSTLVGSTMGFQLAPDAGFGGALYLDGVKVAHNTNDMWWGGSWDNTSQILSATSLTLTAGNHHLAAYWAEGCCNGPQGARFTTDGINWQSTSQLANVAAVPEPKVWVMLLAGLGIVVIRFGRTRRSEQTTSLSVFA